MQTRHRTYVGSTEGWNFFMINMPKSPLRETGKEKIMADVLIMNCG